MLPVGHGSLLPRAADKTAPVLALDAAAHADLLVPDEAPDSINPALVAGQVVVELARNLVQLVQPGPGHGGEIVVLVVQADVVGQEVEGPVVAEGLWDGDVVLGVAGLGRDSLVDVVLRDEVASQRVEGTGEERREDEVKQRLTRSDASDQEVVECELHQHVDKRNPGEGHAEDEHRAQGVEQDLEGAEKGLAKDRVEEDCLKGGRKVCIETIDAEGFVVRQVVWLENNVTC